MPNAVPAANTPAIGDGDVRAIAKVGTTMVIGGGFTTIGGTSRNHIAAFNASTGALTSFSPSVNGEVNAIIPGPTANTVYVAGSFTNLAGTAVQKVALINISTGAVDPTFRAPLIGSGEVNDLFRVGNRLYLAGSFPKVGNVNHAGLASLNATTGGLDPFMNVQLTGHHNDTGGGAQGAVGPWGFDVTPSGDRMIVQGNFKLADGLLRDQVVMIDLTGTQAAVKSDWSTNRYSPYCFNWAFDSYVRGVSFSPDGSYLVVSATGGPNAGTLCDASARFETYSTGTDLQPTWVTETGGDTVWATEITDSAVFVGGHQRWSNNPNGGDSAGAGAVPRPGLMALDPISGRPLQWNPGRNPPGKSVYAILATSEGIWIGSNTDWIGNRKYKRQKIALFPYAGGTDLASTQTGQLPGSVYVGSSQTAAGSNVLYRVNAGGPSIPSTDGGPDWTGDDGGSSPFHNDGANTAGWEPVGSVAGTVPNGTPASIFDTERWDGGDGDEMQWQFPVAAGTPVDVRVYLANRCSCTSAPGSRVFDVNLNGNTFLDDEDIVADAGDNRGTMHSTQITVPASGMVNLSFLHEVENPLVNGIEIVRTGAQPQSNVLYRVNAGGSTIQSLDSGPNWIADDGGSGLRNGGSNAAGYAPVGSVDGTVPASTPAGIFDTERWDPGDAPEMDWRFPVAPGTPIQVRLYLANRCDCTAGAGQRVFDVQLDGQPWLTNEDLVADVGHNRGTMKAATLDAPANGIVDLTFLHKVENTLVNGIEIVRTDIAPPPPGATDTLKKIDFTGSSATAPATVNNGGISWSQTRGAFMVGNKVFYGYTDGFLYSRTFDGTSFGAAQKIDPYHDPVWANVDNNLGGTFNGASPSLYSQMPNITGMTYSDGRLFYTLFGDSNLYWRWFSPDSGIVDERTGTVSSSVAFNGAGGMFTAGGQLYYVTRADGALHKVAFDDGGVTGQPSVSGGSSIVSSPGTDGVNWANRSLFLYNGPHVNTKPTAAFSADCSAGTSCTFNGSGSFDPDGNIVNYAWNFGDGNTASGATPPAHPYQAGGDHLVRLTVTDNEGATDFVEHTVTTTGPPNAAPTAAFTFSCTGQDCSFTDGSSDSDGTIASYAWDFGGDGSSTLKNPTHHFGAVQQYTVRLTVTDDDGATNFVEQTVTTTAPPASNISFVGADHSVVGSKKIKSAVVPAGVQAGDTLVLVFTRATTATWTGPTGVTGWTQRDNVVNGTIVSTVWTKTAVAADAGKTVSMNSSAFALGSLTLAAYHGVNSSVAPTIVDASDSNTANHVTPSATVANGDWAVSYWGNKSDTGAAWTAPGGVSVRDTVADTSGTTRFGSLLADSGAALSAGSYGGLTAQTDTASRLAIMFTMVFKAAP